MITKNANYGKTKNVTVLELGTGDCKMAHSKFQNNEVHLAFKTTEPNPINVALEPYPKGTTMNDIQPELVFIFRKIESIDAVIYMLNSCRKEFEDNKTKQL